MKRKITIRISNSLKNKLSKMSETKEVSVSEVARNILENHFYSITNSKELSTPKNTEQIIENNYAAVAKNSEEQDIIYSAEFYKLLIWMYDQKESKNLKLSKDQLECFKNTINKLQFSNEISCELKLEFDKVYVDLVGTLNFSYTSTYIPGFACSFGENSFDYKTLDKFLFPERIIINLSSF